MISHREPFDRPHLGAALLYSLAEGPLGRRTLVERTGLTESVVRTELNKLEARGLVSFAKAGTMLTKAASERFGPLFSLVLKVSPVDLGPLRLDSRNRAARIDGSAKGTLSWQSRDLAVREGATGTILLRQEAGGLAMPDGDGSFRDRNPQEAERIEEVFGPLAIGDHLVIVFAPDDARAGAGLWRILDDWLVPRG